MLSEHGDNNGYAVYVVHDISRHAEVNRLREQLLYSVAHELRGPLMVLDNALEILDTEYPRADGRRVRPGAWHGAAYRAAHADAHGRPAQRGQHPVRSFRGRAAPRPSWSRSLTDALEIVTPAIDGRGQRVELELPEHGRR